MYLKDFFDLGVQIGSVSGPVPPKSRFQAFSILRSATLVKIMVADPGRGPDLSGVDPEIRLS